MLGVAMIAQMRHFDTGLSEVKFYEIEFPCSVFETPPHAAQSIRGWVLGECNADLLQFLGPLGA